MFVSHRDLPASARPFLRFVVGAESDDVDGLYGLFQFECVEEDPTLTDWERDALEEVHGWFREHLRVPPYHEFARRGPTACWFRSDAGEPVRRMWDLVLLLRELGRPVRFLSTHEPGQLVYYDRHQVVALRPARPRRRNAACLRQA